MKRNWPMVKRYGLCKDNEESIDPIKKKKKKNEESIDHILTHYQKRRGALGVSPSSL